MNESELRRRELLRQTRRLYNDHNEIPAVPGTAASAAACMATGRRTDSLRRPGRAVS